MTSNLRLSALLLVLALSGPSDLAAVGVVVAASPDRSVAILRSEGKTRVVSVGDTDRHWVVRARLSDASAGRLSEFAVEVPPDPAPTPT